ncbi:hypothetical protein [Pengzhenrongella sicca]|uniref:Uncharacterized protein n=1 Tax=Pengzhenrongella sicca TaxID=2819238 RepID=A0A8A4ZL75_9MICO|nr:hypothetical protein [Pengzhenrongella sicca]QTE30328.1 hypothetical protein J4E96_04830 [Pengzhenrongella sicca]
MRRVDGSALPNAMLQAGLPQEDFLELATEDASGDGTGSIECDPNSAVDQAVCDDLGDSLNQDSSQGPCTLADGSAVFTPALAEAANLPVRCQVPDEAELFAALATHGATIDGIADLGNEGEPDYNVFYVVWECGGQPTYWPATGIWSRYKGTSPSLTDERFASASELVDAICA